MTRDTVLEHALRLPVRERADVAAQLLDSLDEAPGEDDEALDRAWAVEIERRGRRVLAGASEGTPWAEARTRIETRRTER